MRTAPKHPSWSQDTRGVSSLLSGEPRRQVDGRFEEGCAPGNTLPEWPRSSECVLVWAAWSSAFNGALCFRRGWRIATRLCAREDRSGGPQVGTWLGDPEWRTGTNRLVPDTGAPPDPAHHCSPQPWPSQGLHTCPRHLPCARGRPGHQGDGCQGLGAADAP